MIRALLLLLLASSAAAQNAIWIDLSGNWRKSPDDRPEYANADVDDSAWKLMRLPRRAGDGPDGRDIYWLRRTVQVPPDMERSDLALTIGPVREVYEVYVNGIRIGATGPFFDDRKAQIAYTRVFEVPSSAVPGTRTVIAIRTRHVDYGSRANSAADHGSFLLSSKARAPFYEAQMMTDARSIRYSSQALFAAILLCLACLTFVLWLAERERQDLFWLTLMLVCRGASGILLFSEISLSVFPFAEFGPGRILRWLHPGVFIPLVELALALHFRKVPFLLRAAVWVSLFALNLHDGTGPLAFVADSVVLGIVVFGWWRDGIRQPWFRIALGANVALLALVQMEAMGGFSFVGLPRVLPTWRTIGSYDVSISSVTFLVLGSLLALLSLRRLIADRVEKQRLSNEIEAARVLQQLLLRKPDCAQIDTVYRPAAEVGGDFWQAFGLEDGGQLLVVGDVSGKGLKAAMLVSLITGALRNRKSDNPSAVLGELNRVLTGGMDGGFVTAAAARFSPTGCVKIANAGHLPPYLDGEEIALAGGLPLGVDDGATYDEHEFRLNPGAQLTVVSDGVIEAANAKGELFGFERTREISTKPAADIAETARAWGQNDDITVVTVTRAAA